MHLAFLTSEYPHPRCTPAAGIGTSIKNMAVALVASGVKVSIFVYEQKEDTIFLDEGIKFHLLERHSFKFGGWLLNRKIIQKYLNKHIHADKIDAIEAPDWTGITSFMKLKCPLVIRMNGSDAYFCHLDGRPQKRKNFWFEKIALKSADYLLSVSEFTANQTAQIFKLKKPIEVIPNSVDIEKFKPSQVAFIQNRILYFGSIIRKKGLLELAEIFNEVHSKNPAAELIIAGRDVVDNITGKSTKALMLEILSDSAKKRVHWLGMLPYEEVQQQIALANVVVLPSFAEALPMTWLEAMAMEKALLTSNIGWAKEVMIDGKTGFTENQKDISSYANKIQQLLQNPILAKEMGVAARERVKQKFSTEVVTKQNVEFYRGII